MRVREMLRRLALLVRRDRATHDLEDEMRLDREWRPRSIAIQGLNDAATATAARGQPPGRSVLPSTLDSIRC